MACFAGWTPEQVLHVVYHLVFIGIPAAFIFSQIFGLKRDSDEYARRLTGQMRR